MTSDIGQIRALDIADLPFWMKQSRLLSKNATKDAMGSRSWNPALFIKPVAFGRVARDASRAVVSFVVGESSFSARSFYGGLGVQMR